MEFCTSANLVVVEAKEEEKIADPCDRIRRLICEF